MTVRTRFAPSPTGFLHVGGIRTALFAFLVARQAQGAFILRFEDTDKKREVAGSAEHLISSLKAIGIEYDEGPDIGGPFAPYIQSQRLDHYKQWAQKLIDAGRAYADPYTSEQIQDFREEAQANKRAFRYRDYRPENPPAWDGTQPLRFKAEPKSYTYHDEVMGDITTSPEVVDDFILIKSDGYLPETMMSFIATLGWNDGTEQEVFTKQELIEKFSLARVQKSGARFDEKRLLWMNGHFIRELSTDELYDRIEFFWPASAKKAPEHYKKQVLALAQDRLKTFKDLPALTSYFFEEPVRDDALITENKQLKKLSTEEISHLLSLVKTELEAVSDWNPENIQNSLNTLLETTGQKPGILFSLIRIVTTWAPFSPQLNDTLALLGKETTLRRITTVLA